MEFGDLALSEGIITNLEEQGITEPTAVQEQSLPHLLDGKDVVAEAETGSGKTLAFALPIIEAVEGEGVQALAIAPTRELAKQIAREIDRFATENVNVFTVYGGVSYKPQIKKAQTHNVCVGTPGRLLDLLKRGDLSLDQLQFFVLDEADRMLDMGFIDDIEQIMDFCPPHRQNILCSATVPPPIKRLSEEYMRDPEVIRIKKKTQTRNISEVYYDVPDNRKLSLLYTLIKHTDSDLCLVFCRTKGTTRFVARVLKHNGVNAAALNGDLSQHKREQITKKFKNGDIKVVVATNVAARGIHVDNISHVFNYDVPQNREVYTHRIGRTGRMGEEGEAVTLLSSKDYETFRRKIKKYRSIERRELPDLTSVEIP